MISTTVMFGLNAASSQYDLSFFKDKSTKATMLSMSSFLQTLFSSLAGLAMGAIVLSTSFAQGYTYATIATLLVTVFTLFFLKSR